MKESQLIELIDGALEVADEASKKVLEIYHSEEQKLGLMHFIINIHDKQTR